MFGFFRRPVRRHGFGRLGAARRGASYRCTVRSHGDVHRRHPCGHEIGQIDRASADSRLSRSDQGLRQARPNHQRDHHAQSSRFGRRRQTGCGLQELGLCRTAAWHSGSGQRRDRRGRHADDVGYGHLQGLPADAGRVCGRQIAQGRSNHSRQDDAKRIRGRRYLWLHVRSHAQSL